MFTIYTNLSGDSGVIAYDIGYDFIRVKFKGERIYRYTYESTGVDDVEQMKLLAIKGKGLSTFIAQHIKGRFAEKES